MTLDHELQAATVLALEAGRRIRQFHSAEIQIGRRKGTGAMVTVADLVSDDVVCSGLAELFPDDLVLSEESPESPDSGWESQYGRIWLVDGLDESWDFADHGDEHAISIGLSVWGSPMLGVVYNPIREELFAGIVGHGATCNGSPVQVTLRNDLGCARISTPRSEWRSAQQRSVAGMEFVPANSVSYMLARVAAGMEDGAVCLHSSRTWSTCAGVALVRAAAGRATLEDNRNVVYLPGRLTHPAGIVGAGPDLHHRLLQMGRSL